jgi:hypothetical protein
MNRYKDCIDTLRPIKVRRFLAHQHAFKLPILAALLKPNTPFSFLCISQPLCLEARGLT